MLSSHWERSPNCPPPCIAVPIGWSSSFVHAFILRINNLQSRVLASPTLVSFVGIALEFRVGHHESIIAAVGITHESVGLTVTYPFSITQIAKLIASTDFQVKRKCPGPLLTTLKGMR